MKKIHISSKGDISRVAENRSFRRWAKQLFASWINHQRCDCPVEVGMILEKLEEIKESIDIIAREMHRQAEKHRG